MLWATLDIIECATIVSSLATLAMAISSVCQMRRSQRDSFYPVLSVDNVKVSTRGDVTLQIRNYGTGPALNVEIYLQIDGQSITPAVFLQNHPLNTLHVATNESKEINLKSAPQAHAQMLLRLEYKCIRHRQFQNTIPLEPYLACDKKEPSSCVF